MHSISFYSVGATQHLFEAFAQYANRSNSPKTLNGEFQRIEPSHFLNSLLKFIASGVDIVFKYQRKMNLRNRPKLCNFTIKFAMSGS